jgi:hypothetical protein
LSSLCSFKTRSRGKGSTSPRFKSKSVCHIHLRRQCILNGPAITFHGDHPERIVNDAIHFDGAPLLSIQGNRVVIPQNSRFCRNCRLTRGSGCARSPQSAFGLRNHFRTTRQSGSSAQDYSPPPRPLFLAPAESQEFLRCGRSHAVPALSACAGAMPAVAAKAHKRLNS